MALPGILTAAIFSFTASWNELLYPIVFVNGSENRMLTPRSRRLRRDHRGKELLCDLGWGLCALCDEIEIREKMHLMVSLSSAVF